MRFIVCLYLSTHLRTQDFLNNENPLFSQVPSKGKVGRRASPGREKTHPGAKHRGVEDFTPTAAPTLPKKLINSILGIFGRGGRALRKPIL